MITERNFGTLKTVIAATSNKFSVFVGRSLLHILEAGLSVILGLLIGIVFFGISFQDINYPLFLFCILISMFTSMGFGLLIGSLGILVSDLNFIMNFSYHIIMIFSGALIPLHKFPFFIEKLCNILPLTNGMQAARFIALDSNYKKIYELLLIEFLKGVVFFLCGYFSLSFFEKQSKYKGTIGL